MPQYTCISSWLDEKHQQDQEKKFLRRYNRMRIRMGMRMITLSELKTKRKWKWEKQDPAWQNRKKNWGEELRRKRIMYVMVRWNRLRVRQNLPPLDCKQVMSAVGHAKDRRLYLKRVHRSLKNI